MIDYNIDFSTMNPDTPLTEQREVLEKRLAQFLHTLLTGSQFQIDPEECAIIVPYFLKKQISILKDHLCNDEIKEIYSKVQEEEQFRTFLDSIEGDILFIEDVAQIMCDKLKVRPKFKEQFLKHIVSARYSAAQAILSGQQKTKFHELLVEYKLSENNCSKEALDCSYEEIVLDKGLNKVKPFDIIMQHYLSLNADVELNTVQLLKYLVELFSNLELKQDSLSQSWETLPLDMRITQFQAFDTLSIDNISPNLLNEVIKIIKLCQLNLLYTTKLKIENSAQKIRLIKTLEKINCRINQLASQEQFLNRMKVRSTNQLPPSKFDEEAATNTKLESLKQYIFNKEHQFYHMLKSRRFKVSYNYEEHIFQSNRQNLAKKLEEISKNKTQNLILFYKRAGEEDYFPLDLSNNEEEYQQIKVYEKEPITVNLQGNRIKLYFSRDLTFRQMKELMVFEINQKRKTKILVQNSRLSYTFKTRVDKPFKESETIHSAEGDYGEISSIQVELQVSITLYYKAEQYEFLIWQNEPISNFKLKIKEKLEIPIDSQIIKCQCSKDLVELESKSSEYTLAKMKIFDEKIAVSLDLKTNLQFYGFHSNIQLEFSKFKQFFIQNAQNRNDYLSNLILQEEEETLFFNTVIPYIFSSIKKRLDLQSLIRMFREEVCHHSKQEIWTSLKQFNTFNPTFLLYYILYNSDRKLRVQIMNLAKHFYPLPIYFKEFSSISNIENSFVINQELAWILKGEANIVSLGLHSDDGENEFGKSDLLNKIFYTNFIPNSSKHNIVSSCPEISLRIYENTYPVNLIDISSKIPKEISEKLLSNANFVILHSWRSADQTKQEIKRIKSLCGNQIYVLTIMRDVKMSSHDNWMVRAQKLISNTIQLYNLSVKIDPITIQIIMKQVKKIVHQKVQEELFPTQNPFPKKKCSLFENQNFSQFQKILLNLSEILTQFRPVTKRYKQLEANCESTQKLENQLKSDTELFKLHPSIQTIISYILNNMSDSDLLIERLRQKIKSYRQQFEQKYKILIYAKKDLDRLTLVETKEYQEKIKSYMIQVSKLQGIKPILTDTRENILNGLSQAIDQYQNNIKSELISIELFWRELYLLVNINPLYTIADQQLIDFIVDIQRKQIFNGQPFELLDGDTLRMPKMIIKKIFDTIKGTAATVIILGPQSSGKSTLLNYLFGCDFKTSQGRCTRGVYGTYYNISNSSVLNCQSIFLIDTEGLLAITSKKDQKVRTDFDSKLILFCLSIADFVIVNTKSDLDSETIGKLKASKQRLSTFSENSNPEFWLVMNQSQTSDLSNKANDVNRLQDLFDLGNSRCLSQAFDTKVLSSEHICILGEDILTKKKSRNDFQKMTLKLLNDLMQRVAIKPYKLIPQIIQKMEVIWSTIERFPDLGKNVNNGVKEIDLQINKWKQAHTQKLLDLNHQLLNQFQANTKKADQIQNEFLENKRQFEQMFIKSFSSEQHDQSIRQRVEMKKKIIAEEFDYIFKRLKYGIQDCEIKKKIKIEEQEGNIEIKIQIKRINDEQSEKSITLSEEQKIIRFDTTFNKTIQKLQKSVDSQKQAADQFKRVKQSYESRMKQYSLSIFKHADQLVLPKYSVQPDSSCSYQECREKALSEFKCLKQMNLTISNSTKPHTNVLKGGKTDALLKYFDMNDYFENKTKTMYVSISKQNLFEAFKSNQLYNEIRKEYQKTKEQDEHNLLLSIVEQINQGLTFHGYRFQSHQKVASCIRHVLDKMKDRQHKNILFRMFDSVLQLLQNRKQSLKLEKVSRSSYLVRQKYLDYKILNYSIVCLKDSYSQSQILLQHLSAVIIRKVVNMNIIYQQIDKSHHIGEAKVKCMDKFGDSIEQQCRLFGIQINGKQVVRAIIENKWLRKDYQPYFKKASKCDLEPVQSFNEQLHKLTWFDPKKIKMQIKHKQQASSPHQICLAIFQKQYLDVKNNNNKHRIKEYLSDQNRSVINYLKNKDIDNFLWEQLDSKHSFDRLFEGIDKIIQESISKNSSLKKSIQQVFYGVTKEIQIFNDDIGQVSRKLTYNFEGHCHMFAMFMTWKSICIKDHKISQKPVEEWKQQRQKQLKYFMNMTSNEIQKVCQGEVEQFIQKLVEIYNHKIEKVKQKIFKAEKDVFKQNITREYIQKQADHEIFKVGADTSKMVIYIEHPETILEQKIDQAIEKSINNLHHEIKQQMYHIKIYNEIKEQISQTLQKMISVYEIKDSQGQFSCFFKVEGKMQQSISLIDGSINQKSSIIFMKYLINNILNKIESSYDCQAFTAFVKQQKVAVSFNTILSQQATEYFEAIEKHNLSMTNIILFLTKLSQRLVEIRDDLFGKMAFKKQQIELHFVNLVKISICSDKCPCCSRICGLQGSHNGPHQCVFGHQIRAFAGSMFENGNASVSRCQDMTDTSQLKYNGRLMSWKQFKDQQANRGWNFDDLTVSNTVQQSQFYYAWKTIGDHFCTKYNMKFVEFNSAVSSVQNQSTHFIIALDQSSSMKRPTKWPQVINTLNQILPTIKDMPDYENKVKISILLLSSWCRIHQQNQSPNNTDFNSIKPSWGGTHFAPTFETAYRLMEKYSPNSNIMFILLTDGGAQFPRTEINLIKQLKAISKNKIYYSGIEFQTTGQVMKNINSQLDGKSYNAATQKQLLTAFTNSIEVIRTQ